MSPEETPARSLWHQAETCHEAGNDLYAIALLTQALMADEELSEARLLRARLLLSMGSAAEAEADADRLLQTPSPAAEALLLKAALCLHRNDTEAALLYYNKVKEHYPQEAGAYVGLSRTYSALHRLDQALQVMDRAVEQLPDHAAVYRERGRIRLLLNDKAGAMDDLKKALQADPETARTLEGHFSNLEQYRTKDADKQI